MSAEKAEIRDNQGRNMSALIARQAKEKQAREESATRAHAAYEVSLLITPLASWQEIEGEIVLRCGDADFAALPVSGRKNSKVFEAFRVSTREALCQIRNTEVYRWLRAASTP